MSTPARAKCPRCGALLMADATWCGQCFLNFRPVFRARRKIPPPPPRPDVVRVHDLVETARADGRAAVASAPASQAPVGWTCPVCRFQNPLERNVCEVCTTPFSRLFEEKAPPPAVDANRVMVASLIFPGLGHAAAGRIGEGVSRAVLFLWSLATAVALVMFHAPKAAGPLGPMAWLFFTATAAVYASSVVDSVRLARGEDQILSSRILLYGSAALVILSMASLFVLVIHASSMAHQLRPSS